MEARSPIPAARDAAHHEKRLVALSSVLAAVALTTFKVAVGFSTGSIGILSEAAHSGLDLVAAAMTFFAVRASGRPADREHAYGHGKVENLSALVETLLLLVTCAWIVREALTRLFFAPEAVEVTWWSFRVMAVSMVIDITRSRMLRRMAEKHNSQALEADAIHFSTDLLSSAVVIVGILMTMAGFENFDSIAALGVAAVTAVIGYRLWKRSVHTLMDGAPAGLSDVIAAEIMSVPGIHRVERIRVRESGAITFVEATVLVDQVLPVEQGHRLTEEVGQRIRSAIPNADVVVHAEPICLENASLEDRIRAEGATMPEVRSVHNIAITEGPEGRLVEFHVEMDGELTVEKGHESASLLEDKVARLDPCIAKVVSHIEPVGCLACKGEASEMERELIQRTIDRIAYQFPEVRCCRDIHVHSTANGYRVFLCCQFDPQLTVNRAHEVVTRLEGVIRSRHTEIESVTIHLEPV